MLKRYKITSDLFTLPYKDGNSMLYAPRLGFLCIANDDVLSLLGNLDYLEDEAINADQRATLEFLEQKNILNGKWEYNCTHPLPGTFCPTSLTLFPTNQCNLRCIYCYASAGEYKPLVMDWHFAVSAVERLIEFIKNVGIKQLSIGFHGGGEPLYPWDLIKRVILFAEKRCSEEGLQPIFFAASNGVLSENQLEWITQHFNNLNISFDGLPQIQDYHRPLINGNGSFEYVDRTLRFLDKHNFSYGIRSTISASNLHSMEEIVDYIGKNYKPQNLHFEPLFYCGRCKTTGTMNPDLDKFADNFITALEKSSANGIFLSYSGCQIENLKNSFCGVATDNFSVTPDGYLTTCFEVTTIDDPKSEYFFIGHIDHEGQLKITQEKRQFLHRLRVDNLEFCKDCFAKWHCAGECAAKLGHHDYLGERGNDRCRLNRNLIRKRLQKILEKEK